MLQDRRRIIQALSEFDERRSWRKLSTWTTEIPDVVRRIRGIEKSTELDELRGYDYAVYSPYSSQTVADIAGALYAGLYKNDFRPDVIIGGKPQEFTWDASIELVNKERIVTTDHQIEHGSGMVGWALVRDIPEEFVDCHSHRKWSRNAFHESSLTAPSAEEFEHFEIFDEPRPAEEAYRFIALWRPEETNLFEDVRLLTGVKNKRNDAIYEIGEIKLSDVMRTANWFEQTHATHTADYIRFEAPVFRSTANSMLGQAVGLAPTIPMTLHTGRVRRDGAISREPALIVRG